MNIGFVSGRIAGTDGVSLETHKWAQVLEGMGHKAFYCAGELEEDGPPGLLVPEMYFHTEEADWIVDHAYGTTQAHPELRPRIRRLADHSRSACTPLSRSTSIDLLVPENALTIPIQISLAIALAELIEETGIPVIAHHHDFYWEREVYLTNCIQDLLDRYFPPRLPSIRHTVINSPAQRDLKARFGLDAVVVPNVFDFAVPAPQPDAYSADLRDGDRPDARGSPDLAADAHHPPQGDRAGDRAGGALGRSAQQVCALARHRRGPGLPGRIGRAGGASRAWTCACRSTRSTACAPMRDGNKVYGLWDVYPHADFVTYPSLYEGFGNALIEAIYFKLPTLVNRYSVYEADIGPLGFDLIEIDGEVTDEAVEATRERAGRIRRGPTADGRDQLCPGGGALFVPGGRAAARAAVGEFWLRALHRGARRRHRGTRGDAEGRGERQEGPNVAHACSEGPAVFSPFPCVLSVA